MWLNVDVVGCCWVLWRTKTPSVWQVPGNFFGSERFLTQASPHRQVEGKEKGIMGGPECGVGIGIGIGIVQFFQLKTLSFIVDRAQDRQHTYTIISPLLVRALA